MQMLINDLLRKLPKLLCPGTALLLYGPMGSGKTFFTKQLCQALHITDKINSPTYTLTNTYNNQQHIILHTDLYRIPSHLIDICMISEIFSLDAINIIEWAEKIPLNLLSLFKTYYKITFSLEDQSTCLFEQS